MEKVNSFYSSGILLIAAGGALGAIMRYWLVHVASTLFGLHYPYGTLIVNVIGCFFAGILLAASTHWQLPLSIKLGIMVGFLGALTTFSAFSIETLMLFEKAQWSKAIINIGTNVFGSLTGVYLGYWLIKKMI